MSRLRRVDPWGPLFALVSTGIFLLQGFQGTLVRDVALFTYSAQQFAEGVPPYVAVLNRSGPLAHIVPGTGVAIGRVFGVDDLLAARVTLMILSVACVWVMYLLGRDLFGSRLAGATAATALLSFEGFVTYATGGPRDKTTMVVFMVVALWALARGSWFWSGAATALATLSLQPGFFPVAAAALLAALVVPGVRAKLGGLGRFALGGVVVTAVTVLGFAAAGALREFIEGFIAIHLEFTAQRGMLKTLENRPYVLRIGYGYGTDVLIGGMAAMVVLGVARLWKLDRSMAAHRAVLGMALGTVVGVLWTLKAFQSWPDGYVWLPFGAAGAAGAVHAASSLLPRRIAVAVVALLCTGMLVLTAVDTRSTRTTQVPALRTQVTEMLELAGPDPTVLSVGAPHPLVLGGLENPIRQQMFRSGLDRYLDQELPGGLEGLAADIEGLRPTYITMDEPRPYPWLHPVLDRHYVRVSNRHTPFAWFVSDAVPKGRIAEMRALLWRVPAKVKTG